MLSCEGQAARGHRVGLAFGPIYGPEGSLLERVRAHGGIETIETPRLVREVAPLEDLRCHHDLRRIIREWRPDVVHTHSSKAGILGRFAAWHERVPCIVHTIHGLPFHRYGSRLRNAMYVLAERMAARRCHRIVSVADAMTEQALAAGIGRRGQFVTIHSGIEVERFLQPARGRDQMRTVLGIGPDEFVLGTVARLAELKGHDDLLDALGPVLRQRKGLRLLWVGDGWWRDRLLERVKTMGLAGRVIATGLVSPEEVPDYVSAMDALAHPSYREGLPRAVPQALLAEVPVVVYDIDGAAEACPDGEVGRLITPGDRNALRRAVEWFMDHPDERRAMGRRGRALSRERFAAETMIDRLEALYASVLDDGGTDGAGVGAAPAGRARTRR